MVQVVDKTFRKHPPYVVSSLPTTTRGLVQVIRDALTQAATDPGGCAWSEAEHDDTIGSNGVMLMLKSNDPDISGFRAAIYGGEPAHDNQQRTNQTSVNYLYCSSSLNHNSDVFDADFTTSTEMMSGGYVDGLVAGNANTLRLSNRVMIIEKGDLLLLVLYAGTASVHVMMLGNIGRTLTNEQMLGQSCTGVAIPSNQLSSVGATGILGASTAGAAAAEHTYVYVPETSGNQDVHKSVFFISTDLSNFETLDGQSIIRVKIPLHLTGGHMVGYAHQLYISKDAVSLATITDGVTGQEYITISSNTNTAHEAYWLSQPAP